ncbi:unnamed protein product, partial [Amoebophrya sp. A25]|eukprot:GSA25T00018108001.1
MFLSWCKNACYWVLVLSTNVFLESHARVADFSSRDRAEDDGHYVNREEEGGRGQVGEDEHHAASFLNVEDMMHPQSLQEAIANARRAHQAHEFAEAKKEAMEQLREAKNA